MNIIITIDEGLTVGACIEGVESPSQDQCLALRNLAQVAGVWRHDLLGTGLEDDPPPDELRRWGNTATPDDGW